MRPLLVFLAVVLVGCSSSSTSTSSSAESGASSGDAKAYLDKAAAQPGAVRTASGLVYRELRAGSGESPKASDTVTVNYRGTLVDGTEFDSSYKRGQPATFPVSGVIKGWTEAVQLMPVGSKWQLFLPADLAYGNRGAGPDIGPNATLIFEVELLSIQNKAAAQAPNPQAPPNGTGHPKGTYVRAISKALGG